MSPSLSDSLALPSKSSSQPSALRRALTTQNPTRHSIDEGSPVEKESETGKFSKLAGKRVRAVSLRMSKRYSLLGQKPEKVRLVTSAPSTVTGL